MPLVDDFIEAFAPFPDRAQKTVYPYLLDLFDENEMRLVVAMKGESSEPLSSNKIQSIIGLSKEETQQLIDRSIVRGILKNRKVDGETCYFTTMMPRRLFTHVTFEEGWSDVPLNVRKILSAWMHRVYYYERYTPMAEKMKRGGTRPAAAQRGHTSPRRGT